MSSGPDGGIGAHGRTTAVHDPRDGNHDDGNHDDGIHDTDWGVFLFTDLEGSTKAWERSPRQMNEVLIEHDRILRDAVDSHGGTVFSWSGDAFAAHFSEIHSAVTASVAAQHVLAGTEWPGDLVPRVRIGIHAGVAYRREGNWFGPCLNRCARIMAAGHGGQILVSEPIASTVAAFDELGAGEVAVKPMGTHRLKDVTEPVELWQLTAPGLIVDFPPLTSITGPADRIPQSRTSFIGRDGDLRQLRELASTERLVTVVAAGGTGKTRLAYETAFTIAPDFNGGTFVVEMADSDADDLAFRTGGAILGDDPLARIEGSTDPLQAAIDHLGSKRCLLVVDNCEHVRHEAAEIVHAITAACPDVHVIATSRVPLGLSGEQVMWLEPLAIGSPDDPGPAVQLFLDRATAVRPDLPLDDAQMDAIKTICRLLDGLPLGVELAAARSTMSLPTEILPKLGDSLRLLRDRKGVDRPERQRSLEATITWSYQQLDELEQRLLQVCSVFAGGFDLDAVCAVGASTLDLDDYEVMDTVEDLIANSLVSSSAAEGSSRYRMSEPIRQFARGLLEESGWLAEAHVAHVEWFSGVAKSHVPDIDEAPDPVLIRRLRLEHDNFLVAVSRAVERDDLLTARRLTVGLHNYWEESGYISTGARLLRNLLGVEQGEPPSESLPSVMMEPAGAQALGLLTTYSSMIGDLELAQQLATMLAVTLDIDLPPKAKAAIAFTLGFVDRAAGNTDRCLERWTLAGDLALQSGETSLARQAYCSAAYGAAVSTRIQEATDLLDLARSVPQSDSGWFPHHARLIEGTLTVFTSSPGDPHLAELAVQCDRDAQAIDDLGLRFRTLLSSAMIGLVAFRSDREDLGRRWWRRGLVVGQDMGHLWGCWILLEYTGWTLEAEGRPLDAAEVWGAVDGFGERHGYRQWGMISDEGDTRRARARSVDPDAFDAAWTRGTHRRGLSEIVNAALS